MAPAADKFESMLTGLASSITEVQNTLASLLIKANHGRIRGGSRGSPPPFVPRCRLFNIGPKIGPPSGPPFLLVDLIWTPPPLSKILDPPCENASSIQDLKISTIKADKDIHNKLDDYMYIQNNQELKQDINLVNKRVEVLEGEVAELKAIRSQEVESKRQLTLVIKGIPETKNEKLHITMDKLLDTLGTSSNYSATNGAVRIGKLYLREELIISNSQGLLK